MNGLENVQGVSEPSPGDVARLGGWLRIVRARAAALPQPAVSFLVVTPLGLPEREWLWKTLSACGAVLLERCAVPAWPAVSTALHVKHSDREALRRAVSFENAWEALFPGVPAEAWTLAPGSHARVEAVKHAVRAGMRHLRVELGPRARPAVLHPFHLADSCDAGTEARLLLAALSLVGERSSGLLPTGTWPRTVRS